ncbi:MAG: hypothetical protein QOH03_1813, partial [Kribbellaceae bacterium]|nr:hypothetical protein [Kribbellaceae bacterium]
MRRKNLLRVYATAACAALAASLVSVVPTTASAAEVKPKEAQKLASVPGGTVPVKPPAKSTNEVLQGTPAVNWPTATAAEVSLTKNKAMKAGSAPVSLTSTTDAKVKLEVLSQAESAKAGVAGVLVKVTRSDQAKTAAPVSVTVDYSGFRNAYGGDWAARLRLVPLAGNRTPIPVKNDFKTGKLTGQVTAPKQGATYALTAGDDSTAGDYKATSLSPSGEWQVSAQTGSFSWKYPMRVPPVPGDLTPTLAATYNSGAVDGRVPSANNQTSWLGEGWDLASGSIERRYKGCADDPGSQGKDLTADLCWSLDNATLSLDGHSSELVKDGSTDNWRLKNDDGSKLEHLYGTSNGDENGEYWRLTTIDGTQYNFGLNKIPNRADTQSAWTVPVAGNNANEPCSKATFATSFCDQAYRWNLDYVVDPHGNTVIYTYTKDLNKYGRNLGTATASYTRSGALQMIEYGTKAGVAGNAPARVLFGTTDRCAPGANCATKTPQSWPDVPWDRECTGNTCPEKYSPTFWSTQKLSTVTTQILGSTATCQADATGYCGVDRWSLEHTYPKPGDNSDPALWLDAIKHAGLVGGTTAPLTTSFVLDPINKANRVDSSPDGLPPGNKHRIRDINTESGGQIEVNYARPSCRPGATPAPDNNTALCYPVRWAPDKADVTDDWFNKYVVSSIALIDRVGGGPTQFTHYDYEGTPGWAYRDDPMTPEKYRSWTDWRGFDQVLVRTGDPDSPGDKAESATRYRYFRGLNGDKIKAGGNRTVKVDGIADDPALAGFLR